MTENENLIKKQQAVADRALVMSYLIDPFAIVAGGAPRDWYFNKPAKDIDLFFSVKDHVQIHIINEMLKIAGFEVDSSKAADDLPDWYNHNPNIRAVFNAQIDDVDVQLILVKDSPFKVVNQFPLSICKAWYKNGQIQTDKDFNITVKHKSIFKTNTLYAQGNAYLKKVLDKFKDFQYYDNLGELLIAVYK